MSATEWKQRPEGGGLFAKRLLIWIGRHGGRRLARPFLLPITAYFLLRRSGERRASQAYLSRVLGRRAGWFDSARHLHAFSSTILDRLFLLTGKLSYFDVSIDGLDEVHTELDRGRGVLLFGSHLGSFEVMRVLALARPDYTIRVVLDRRQNPALTALLDALNPIIAGNVIDASQDGPSIALAIKQATDQGHLVALLVDRVRPGEGALPVDFLGQTALFPTAPWLIAAALQVPVVLAFGLYEGGHRYRLVFETFSAAIGIPRHNRQQVLGELIARYAARLAHHARQAPYNWFNFYDFWQDEHAHDPTSATPLAAALRAGQPEPAPRDGAGLG